MIYELSDLETTRIDGHDTVHKLKRSQKQLLDELASKEDSGASLKRKLRVSKGSIWFVVKGIL